MSLVYVVKRYKQEYCANNIEYGKQSANNNKNEHYEGDGKA